MRALWCNGNNQNLPLTLSVLDSQVTNGVLNYKMYVPPTLAGRHVVVILNPDTRNLQASNIGSGGTLTTWQIDSNWKGGYITKQVSVVRSHEGIPSNGSFGWKNVTPGIFKLAVAIYPSSPFRPGTEMEYYTIEELKQRGMETAVVTESDYFNILANVTQVNIVPNVYFSNYNIKSPLNLNDQINFRVNYSNVATPSKLYVIANRLSDGQSYSIQNDVSGQIVHDSKGSGYVDFAFRLSSLDGYNFFLPGQRYQFELRIEGDSSYSSIIKKDIVNEFVVANNPTTPTIPINNGPTLSVINFNPLQAINLGDTLSLQVNYINAPVNSTIVSTLRRVRDGANFVFSSSNQIEYVTGNGYRLITGMLNSTPGYNLTAGDSYTLQINLVGPTSPNGADGQSLFGWGSDIFTLGSIVTQAPTISITPSNKTISVGEILNLNLSTTNANNCSISGGIPSQINFSALATNGNGPFNVSPTVTTTYAVSCSGINNQSTSESFTVNVIPKPVSTMTVF